jgi:hypothetical protein
MLKHFPQFRLSRDKSTHLFPQSVSPGGQLVVQIPFEHVWPDGHALLHRPQLAGSVLKFLHLLPVPGFPSGQQLAAVGQ